MGILASMMPLLAVGLSVLLLGEAATVGGVFGELPRDTLMRAPAQIGSPA